MRRIGFVVVAAIVGLACPAMSASATGMVTRPRGTVSCVVHGVIRFLPRNRALNSVPDKFGVRLDVRATSTSCDSSGVTGQSVTSANLRADGFLARGATCAACNSTGVSSLPFTGLVNPSVLGVAPAI